MIISQNTNLESISLFRKELFKILIEKNIAFFGISKVGNTEYKTALLTYGPSQKKDEKTY